MIVVPVLMFTIIDDCLLIIKGFVWIIVGSDLLASISTQLETLFEGNYENPTLATFLPTIDTCLHIDWEVLRTDLEPLHVDFYFRPEYHTLTDFLKDVVHTLEAEFVGCIVDMISSLEHDGLYSLRWVWDPGLYCNCLRTSNFERGGFVTSLIAKCN